jgi:hypothetical protein
MLPRGLLLCLLLSRRHSTIAEAWMAVGVLTNDKVRYRNTVNSHHCRLCTVQYKYCQMHAERLSCCCFCRHSTIAEAWMAVGVLTNDKVCYRKAVNLYHCRQCTLQYKRYSMQAKRLPFLLLRGLLLCLLLLLQAQHHRRGMDGRWCANQ